MIRPTFFGLEIGKSGLVLSQVALDVTGHNIANVNTAGFTRQRIISTAYDPFAKIGRVMPVNQALVGMGTHVKVHDQIRSVFLDRRYRTENTINSYWQKRTENLIYLESYFDNVNEDTSISFSIARFFEAMKVLSGDTVEGAQRTQLRTAGIDIAQQLNMIYAGMIDLQETQNQAIGVVIKDINSIALKIAELNKSIYSFEITGHEALDLRDKRNLLIDELSTLVDVQYEEYPDGKGHSKFKVSIDGIVLVDHKEFGEIGYDLVDNYVDGELEGANSKLMPKWITDAYGGNIDTPVSVVDMRGGEMKAYLDMRDGDGLGTNAKGIPYYIQMLNNLARAIVQEINEIHRQGWTDHPVDGSKTGVNFFFEDAVWYTLEAWFDDDGTRLYPDPANPGDWLDGDGDPATPVGAVTSTFLLDTTNIRAKDVKLSDEVMKSEYNIACSTVEIVKKGEAHELQRGNNENMNNLYKLFLKKDITLEIGLDGVAIGSFDGYATSIRFDVGNTLNFAKRLADNSNTLSIAAENQRLSVAGVSLDEEMTNLIRYQHAYSGSSRVITTMDEMLDKLINGTGRVGL